MLKYADARVEARDSGAEPSVVVPADPAQPTVFIIEDCAPLRRILTRTLELDGYRAEGYATAEAYLAEMDDDRPGCLVLDLCLPGMGGLALLEHLAAGDHPPVILLSGHGDVPTVSRAFRAGAVDFLQKPFEQATLRACIARALERDRQRRAQRLELARVTALLHKLSPRERQILDLVMTGETTKSAAMALGLSPKTIDYHRARVMRKLGVVSLIELARLMFIVKQRGVVEPPGCGPSRVIESHDAGWSASAGESARYTVAPGVIVPEPPASQLPVAGMRMKT